MKKKIKFETTNHNKLMCLSVYHHHYPQQLMMMNKWVMATFSKKKTPKQNKPKKKNTCLGGYKPFEFNILSL